MKTKEKVLVVTTTYPTFLSGDATPGFVHELTRRLVEKGNDILVLTPRRPGTRSAETHDGVRICRYPYFFISARERLADGAILPNLKRNKRLYLQIPCLMISGLVALVRLARKESITTIHAHRLFQNGFLGALYKKFWNPAIRLVCTAHGSDVHSLHGGLMNRLQRRTLLQTDTLTVVSSFLKQQLDTLTGKDLDAHIIPMGVDQQKFNPRHYDAVLKSQLAPEGKWLLFVGRLAEEKGIADLIAIMPAVLTRYPGSVLVIIGDGPLRQELEAFAQHMGVASRIRFLGALPNDQLPKFYATADLFVLPSYKEGSPVVLVEALFSGARCVGRRIPQLEEIVEKTSALSLFSSQEECIQQVYDSLASEKVRRQDELSIYYRQNVTLAFSQLLGGKK